MVIQKMNNVLVKHSKILFGIFTAVIIVSFVWFFTPGVDGSLLFGGGVTDRSMYGTFMNEKITYGEVKQAMRRMSLLNRGASVGDQMAFFFAAQGKAADRFGITVSDAELQKQISSMFQEDGKFSPAKYAEFEKSFLQPAGYSVAGFEDALREALRVEKAQVAAVGNVALSDAELKDSAATLFEKFNFSVIQFYPDNLVDMVQYTDQELEQFYNANPANFLPPPTFDGIAFRALNADFKAEITDAKVKAYYDAHKSEYTAKDGKVTPLDKVSAKIKETLEKTDTSKTSEVINNFYKTVREASRTPEFKTDFVALTTDAAKKAGLKIIPLKGISAETMAPVNGVDLAALQAMTNLKRVGSVTNKIPGADGFTVILLTNRVEHKETTFQEAKNRVINAYKLAKAVEFVPVQVAKFRSDLAQEKDPAAAVKKLAEKYHGVCSTMPEAVDRLMLEQNPYMGNLRKMLVCTEAGKLSAAERQGSGQVMIFVEKRTPADAKELEDALKNPFMRKVVERTRQQGAVMQYEEWLRSNCRLSAREAQNQKAPDQAAD